MGSNYFCKLYIFFIPLILCFHSSLTLISNANHPEVVLNIQVPFSYNESTGRGPSKWGELDPTWRACDGKLQSPIDLNDKNLTLLHDIGDLKMNYYASNAVIMSTGHDILVNWTGNAGHITIENVDYNLQQVHWHTPSEHSFNGTRYDLELHIVHGNSERQTAVIGILYKIGEPDTFLSELFPFIKTVTKQPSNIGIIDPKIIKFGGNCETYYRYNGSLTTPPCTEGVLWTVLEKVRTVSEEQVQALKDAVDDGFQMNARPVQPLNGRAVYLYNPQM